MPTQNVDNNLSNSKNYTMYQMGGISYIIVAFAILFSIIAFFIWPFKPGNVPIEDIFLLLQNDRLGGLISLDLSMLIIIPINVIPMVVLYYILKQVDEFYALLALIFGLIGVALLIPTRPLIELVDLSNQFAVTNSETIRSRLLTEGDLLLRQFNGTAWFCQSVFFLISGVINGILMLRATTFRRITAIMNIAVNLVGLGFFIPIVGLILLFLNTIGTIIVYFFVAADFLNAAKTTGCKS